MKTFSQLFVSFSLVSILVLGFSSSVANAATSMNRKDFIKKIVNALDRDPLKSQYNNCFYDVRNQEYADEVCYARTQGWLDDMYDEGNYDDYYDSYYAPRNREEFFPLEKIRPEDARRIASRAYRVSLSTLPKNLGTTLSTSEANRIIDAAEEDSYVYDDRYDDYRSVNTPDGYPDPWYSPYASVIDYDRDPYYNDPYYNDPYRDGPYYQDPYYSSSCRLSITRPSRTPINYSVSYCPLDKVGEPIDQILLGQRYLASVNGQSLDYTITDRTRAMATAYASEMFGFNPNYLSALAIRESRMSCGSFTDGCFRMSTGAVQTIKDRFSMYFDSSDSYTSLVQNYPTAIVLASLYLRYGEDVMDRTYNARSFYSSSSDQQARTRVASVGFNRGFTDTAVQNILQNSSYYQCSSYSNIFQCPASGTSFSEEQNYIDLCRDLMTAGSNYYDVRLTRQDITNFIDNVLRPTFSSNANINWSSVSTRLQDTFACLQNSDGTISFRYDFKTLLRELKRILPPVQTPYF